MEFRLVQIGKIKRSATGNCLEIEPKYIDGLIELENYNYIHVFWWAHELDAKEHREVVKTKIPYAKTDTIAGVFACRSPERPNPIMTTVCKIRGINLAKGKIYIENIDAFSESPIIDIKPYIHCNDRVKTCKVPKWLPVEWGEWLPAKGIS